MKLIDQVKAIESKEDASKEEGLDLEYRDGTKIIAKAIEEERAHISKDKFGYTASIYFDDLTDEEVEIIRNSNFSSCNGTLKELTKLLEVEVTCVIKKRHISVSRFLRSVKN